jgi:hypothetical protein
MLEFLNLTREVLANVLRIRIERMRGQRVRPRRTANAKINAARRNGFKYAELFRDLQCRVMGQHHACTAYPNARGCRRDRRHQDFWRAANNVAGIMMF